MKKIKAFFRKIPKLPLSALIFYLITMVLWKTNLIPPPTELLLSLQNLYNNFGYLALFVAAFLEGTAYLGLYFPGSTIIVFTVFFSKGTLFDMFLISLIVALTLTLTSFINYCFGRIKKKKGKSTKRIISKGLFLSMLHPNLLAFYFFNAGLEKQNLRKILFVPLVMFPYGFILAFVLTKISKHINNIEIPYIYLSLITIWLVVAYIVKNKK